MKRKKNSIVKGKKIRNKKRVHFIAAFLVLCGIVLGTVLGIRESQKKEDVEASTVVTTGDFRLTALSRWDDVTEKAYVDLDWEDIPDLSEHGYKLFQSGDGGTIWNNVSTKYNKKIKVLNIYPVGYSDTLKSWMEGTGSEQLNFLDSDNDPYIQVTSVYIGSFNANPDSYLKDESGDYLYDVLMFGTWDDNSGQDLSVAAYNATDDFVNTGRGVLFGHDTVIFSKYNFLKFATRLGIHPTQDRNQCVLSAGTKVKVLNNGYLMKYPFEMELNQVLTIPFSHNVQLSNKAVGTTWMEFEELATHWAPLFDDGAYRSAWYLKTNNNLAMIQTGHSNGASTLDERKIIANTLYNLAQVTLDSDAVDYTVQDDVAPNIPEVKLKGGSKDLYSVSISAEDLGKEYQWYVTADTKSNGTKKSDAVKEVVTSGIQGYIYVADNSATTSPTVSRDSYGKVTNINAAVTLPNRTATVNGIDAKNNKWLHIVAVDRANNVSEVKHVEMTKLTKFVEFEVERTADEAKLVDVVLDSSINNKMKTIEVQIPKNTEIKDLSTLTLPSGWYSYQNSDVDANTQSFSFAMTTTNNDLTTMTKFLEDLRFTIKNPVNQSGDIKVIFHEKILTAWTHPDGKTHYYSFVKDPVTWQNAYNEAKSSRYKGMQGYLATITSLAEHDFIYNNIAKNPGWLGGTRMVNTGDLSKIIDVNTISINQTDYNVQQSQWYWSGGPEAGTIFFNGIYRTGGSPPAGVYDGWNTQEPNNNWHNSNEYVLQFAIGGTKLWNDLPAWLILNGWNEGYYVEYSEYGDQVEGDEDTDLWWSAAIPQKVSLKAYDEKGNAAPADDLLFDQQLRIGKAITVTPEILPMYDFEKLVDMNDVEHALSYKITKDFQEGKLLYTNRKVTLHIRQVVTDENSQVVIPKTGYGTIFSQTTGAVRGQDYPVTMESSEQTTQDYTDYVIRSQANEPIYSFTPVIPEYYQLVGYVWTTTESTHDASASLTTPISVDVSQYNEFWLTIYIKPTTTEPAFYGWHYGNDGNYSVSN